MAFKKSLKLKPFETYQPYSWDNFKDSLWHMTFLAISDIDRNYIIFEYELYTILCTKNVIVTAFRLIELHKSVKTWPKLVFVRYISGLFKILRVLHIYNFS